MTLSMDISLTVVLLVFYLVALFHSQAIRKSTPYLFGAAGLIFSILMAGIFGSIAAGADPGEGGWARILGGLLGMVGDVGAFAGLIYACYGDKIPVQIPGMDDADDEATPPGAE
jgi:hypothetical protein